MLFWGHVRNNHILIWDMGAHLFLESLLLILNKSCDISQTWVHDGKSPFCFLIWRCNWFCSSLVWLLNCLHHEIKYLIHHLFVFLQPRTEICLITFKSLQKFGLSPLELFLKHLLSRSTHFSVRLFPPFRSNWIISHNYFRSSSCCPPLLALPWMLVSLNMLLIVSSSCFRSWSMSIVFLFWRLSS